MLAVKKLDLKKLAVKNLAVKNLGVKNLRAGKLAVKRRGRGRPRDLERGARRREEILDAAIHLFARQGYRNTDVQELADELGLGKGTIYRYFPSKRDLFLKAVDHGMRQLEQCIGEAPQALDDPFEHMQRGIRTHLTFFDEHPEVVELLMQERAEFKDRKQQTYFQYRERNAARWKPLRDVLLAAGRVRDLPFDQVADFIGYVFYGTMFTNYFKGRSKSIAQQAREIVDIVTFGLASEAERHRRAQQPPAGERR